MIRMAKMSDFADVLDVFREVQNLHAMNEPNIFKFADPIDRISFEVMLDNPEIKVFVSESEGKVNGFLIGKIVETGSNLSLNRKLFAVENLAVLEREHNKHIGKDLMDTAVSFSKKEQCDGLILSVWVFNQNALGFYKHLGFKEKSIKMELEI